MNQGTQAYQIIEATKTNQKKRTAQNTERTQKNLYHTIVQEIFIQLLDSPIPTAAAVSQKASSDDISGTKRKF